MFADLDVDLSSPASTDAGRHPLPAAASFADAMGRLGISDTTKVVAYDDAGGLVASRLWWMLDALGRPAAVLDGGFPAWDGPTADGPASPAPAVFSPVEWPADCIITKQALAESLDGALTILDARAPDRFAKGVRLIQGRGTCRVLGMRRRVPTSPMVASAPKPSSPSTTAPRGRRRQCGRVLRLWCHCVCRSARSPHGGPPRRTAVRRVVVAVGSRRDTAGRNHAPDPAPRAIYARVMEHIVPESQRLLFDAWHFAPAVVHDGIAFLSGVTGMGPDGRCAADAEEQFTQLFESITLVLSEARLTWSDVIEMTSCTPT